MASLKSAQSSSRIISKLDKLLAEENYYEAHQLYRTIYFRYLNSKRFNELQDLFLKGALTFLEKGQANSGADLASLYIDAVNENPDTAKAFEDANVKEQFANNVGKFYSLIPLNTPERVNLVVKFSKLSSVFPVAHIHSLVARQCWKEDNYKAARTHFLRSAGYGGIYAAQFLIDYQLNSDGSEEEVHLLIAQFILQLLCLTKKADPAVVVENKAADKKVDLTKIKARSPEHQFAITTFTYYTANHPKIDSTSESFSAPVLNFIVFLLISIESGIYDTYKVLSDIYKATLANDSELEKYLTKVGEIYFNVKPRATGGFFGNLLQTFLQDSDEEEETAAVKPQPSSAPQQPETQASSSSNPLSNPLSFAAPNPLPPFSLFERMCQARTTARQTDSGSSRPNLETHEDLD